MGFNIQRRLTAVLNIHNEYIKLQINRQVFTKTYLEVVPRLVRLWLYDGST